ncbi:MAG TPA: DUF3047 domain-containing protein [Methylocella sp.]|nr:DUF3047 domain-containing protein [Methylocella sp.]
MGFHQHAESDPATASAAWTKAIAASLPHLRNHAILDVSASSPGWIDTGLDLRAGEEVTLFSAGRVWLAKDLGIGVDGGVALWHRIGSGGTIAKSIDTTASFRAEEDGRLMLVAKPPGEWLDETGRFDPDYPREGASGALAVAVLVWPGPAREGLAKLRANDESSFAAREIARLDARVPQPAGWRHLWRLGQTQIFRAEPAGLHPARICCETAQDAGILQYPVDVALDRSTRLAWAWKADELPSRVREDSLPTHDYLSIAVEFDNGRDLTYMWSAALPEGKVFQSPLPWWDKRETHQVVRSDLAKVGQWLEEDQAVLDDYERAIGGVPPARIVGVWLIAVSAFQRRKGICDYARIKLKSDKGEVFIGP